MSRQSGFHVRATNTSAPHAGNGFFGKRVAEQKNAQKRDVIDDKKAGRRRHAYKRLAEHAPQGTLRLAALSELSELRVQHLINGEDPFDGQLAFHIEEMLKLPHGWLESAENRPIPEGLAVRLTAERVIPAEEDDELESVFDDQGPPVKPAEPETAAVMVAFAQEPAAPEVVPPEIRAVSFPKTLESTLAPSEKQTPRILVKQSRKIFQNGETTPGVTEARTTSPSVVVSTGAIKPEVVRANLQKILGFFPALRQFLAEKTVLSPSTISGGITGSRSLPNHNIDLIESTFGVPAGWLSQPRTAQEMETEMRARLGEIIDRPAPKRGRKPDEAKESAQPGTPKSQIRFRVAKASTSKISPVEAVQPEPVKQLQPEPQQTVAPEVSATSHEMNDFFMKILRSRLASGKVTEKMMVKVLNLLYEE